LSTTVLVAEDFTSVRHMLVATLGNNPNIRIICEVSDGAQAVKKANELQPDLILLDIGLPSLNGIEAARQIRGLSPKSKIIFVTQETSPEVVTEALEAGASGYVVKTDAGRDLCAAVEAVLRGEQFLSTTVNSAAANLRTLASTVQGPAQKVQLPRLHEVQFYSDDASFLDTFASFIASAIKAGDTAIVVLARSRREMLIQRLQTEGLDISGLSEQGRYLSLDPSDLLSILMVNNLPDRDRFMKIAGDIYMAGSRALEADHNCVALCGECAALLWSQGNAKAAIRLEQLWNEFARSRNIHLLCAYPRYGFQDEMGRQVFNNICAQHSAVYPR
jgi:DNA-binding NarL/FixJ family response regulator